MRSSQAGLFSAVVTAFILDIFKSLQPNSGDATVALLAQISQQLAIMSNSSQSNVPLTSLISTHFQPTTSVLLVNMLWFTSLTFSLMCALTATLVQQWARNYLQAVERYRTPKMRAGMRAYLYDGLQTFGMPGVVEAIPTLLHISLFLFFVGLIEYLRPVHHIVGYIIFGLVITCACLYILATCLPLIRHQCPYQTPLSDILWQIFQKMRLLRRKSILERQEFTNIAQARESDAMADSPRREKRDQDALSWTLESLTDDNEFETFIEGIPEFLQVKRDSSLRIMKTLLNDRTTIQLGTRIARLLDTCRKDGGVAVESRRKRAITCLRALWALGMETFHENSGTKIWRDASRSIGLLQSSGDIIPAISGYMNSTTAVVKSKLVNSAKSVTSKKNLDAWKQTRQSDHTISQQKASQQLCGALLDLVYASYLHDVRPLGLQSEKSDSMWYGEMLERQIHWLECYLTSNKKTEMPSQRGSQLRRMDGLMEVLGEHQDYQKMLNDAGITILLDLVSSLLERPSDLYEAATTIHTIAANLDACSSSRDIQSRLALSLGDAVRFESDGTRLSPSILDAMLSVVATLNDLDSIARAIGILNSYLEIRPDSDKAKLVLCALLEKTLSRVEDQR
jgi:hypothetical protein